MFYINISIFAVVKSIKRYLYLQYKNDSQLYNLEYVRLFNNKLDLNCCFTRLWSYYEALGAKEDFYKKLLLITTWKGYENKLKISKKNLNIKNDKINHTFQSIISEISIIYNLYNNSSSNVISKFPLKQHQNSQKKVQLFLDSKLNHGNYNLKKSFDITCVLTEKELLSLCEKFIIPNKIVIIHTSTHTMAASFCNNKYTLYDPSLYLGEVLLNDINQFVNALKHQSYDTCGLNISIRMEVIDVLKLNKDKNDTKNELYKIKENIYEIEKNSCRQVKMILTKRKNLKLNAKSEFGISTLYMAAKYGNKKLIKWLLNNKAKINIKNAKLSTPLHAACENNKVENVEIAKLLLERGADINAKDNVGQTPLFKATLCNNSKLVKYLVLQKCKVNILDNCKESCLHVAAKVGNLLILKFLIENGGDIFQLNNNNENIFHIACEKGHYKIVKYLLKMNMPINQANIANDTPLHLATFGGFKKIVKLLLEQSDDSKLELENKNNSKHTPLMLAVLNKKKDLVKLLLKNKAKVDEIDSNQKSTLELAVNSGENSVVLELLKTKKYKKMYMNKAMKRAILLGNNVAVKYLMKYGAVIVKSDINNGLAKAM